MIRTPIAAAIAALLFCAAAFGGEFTRTPFPGDPTAQLIVADGWAYIVRGTVPVAAWKIGDVTPVPPDPPDPLPPRKVVGIFLIEEQADRTVKQAAIMDDPVWQAAALAKGLTYRILDKDKPDLPPAVKAAVAKSVLPVVCCTDSDGKVVSVVPMPATLEAMRALIGGTK